MPDQLYDRVEYESALTALKEIVIQLPEPFVLIGGWGVYVTVNESFADEHGAPYLGSRDIDVCFQVDPECRAGFDAITDDVSKKAARHLGIDAETYRGVIRGLIENL